MKSEDAVACGRKIKFLRGLYGETQEQLAAGVNVSLGTVRKYEQGERVPSGDILRRILRRYGVDTLDAVITPPDEIPVFSASFMVTQHEMQRLNQTLFPVFSLKDKSTSIEMGKAIAEHKALFREQSLDSFISKTNYCLRQYRRLSEDSEIRPLAQANRLSLLLFAETVTAIASVACGYEERSEMSFSEIVRANAEVSEKRLERFSELYKTKGELFQEIVADLCSEPLTAYSEIGYYFSAIMVLLGITDIEDSRSMQERIGISMLLTLAYAGNHYALNYWEVMMDLYGDDD